MGAPSQRFLIVDDARIARSRLRQALTRLVPDAAVEEVDCAAAAREVLATQEFTAVFCDLTLPDQTDLGLIVDVLQTPGVGHLAIYSALDAPRLRNLARALGVTTWLKKPPSDEDVLAVLSAWNLAERRAG